MLRIVTLAAATAALASAAEAQEPESIHISVVGKSPDQVRAEVVQAAQAVCETATRGEVLVPNAKASCVTQTVRATMAQPAAKALMLAQR